MLEKGERVCCTWVGSHLILSDDGVDWTGAPRHGTSQSLVERESRGYASPSLQSRPKWIMPGRQYTAPGPSGKTKGKQKAQKRSLNALAIAEKQDPQKQRIRPSRVGKVEEVSEKRKRFDDDNESFEDQEGGQRRSKRVKEVQKDRYGEDIEEGSDNEGNNWKIGAVDSDDDSDLDSDEALGVSDEERFDGFVFRGSSTPKKKAKALNASTEQDGNREAGFDVDLNEDSEANDDDEEESDDFRENAVDLADVLDASEDSHDEQLAKRKMLGADHSSQIDSSASEASDDESSALSLSDAEIDGNDAHKLSTLQTLVSSMAPVGKKEVPYRMPDAQEAITPSEYNLNPRQKLTIADLLPTVTDPTLRRSLKILADGGKKSGSKKSGIPQKLEVPLPKRQQDRLDRSAAYEKSKETLNRWIDTIKHNRRAEHLSFPLVDPAKEGSKFPTKMSATRTKPITDLESTIQNILTESGLSATNGKAEGEQIQAFEELQANKLPIEEVQARRAELRKARELLFREEIKAKRIKKIKSKSYRRVHRKERERNALRDSEALAAAGIELSEDEQERQDRRRAEERMGARYRESKWAKSVRQSGRAAWDEDARDGVTEMARRGEELRRRVEGKAVHDEDESVDSESSSEADDDDSTKEDQSRGVRFKDKLNRLQESNPFLPDSGNSSGLASMKFMQKADEIRRKQNDEDIARLKREIDGELTSEESANDGEIGRRAFGPKSMQTERIVNGEAGFPKGEFEEGQESENEYGRPQAGRSLNAIANGTSHQSQKQSSRPVPVAKPPDRSKSRLADGQIDPEEENPWLTTKPTRKSKSDRKRTSGADENVLITNGPVPMEPAKSSASGPKGTPRKPASPPPQLLDEDSFEGFFSSDSDSPKTPTNQDLIRRAFAGDDVLSSFAAEKAATITSEAPQTISTALPGWGSWTGAGISAKAEKRALASQNRFNKSTLTTMPGIEADKRVDKNLDKVIVNEKRVKKNAKYLAGVLPHPFETKAQYERSLRVPVGPEWTTKEVFQRGTKPRVLLKQGIIGPMEKPLV